MQAAHVKLKHKNVIAKVAFNKKRVLFASKLDLNLRKDLL